MEAHNQGPNVAFALPHTSHAQGVRHTAMSLADFKTKAVKALMDMPLGTDSKNQPITFESLKKLSFVSCMQAGETDTIDISGFDLQGMQLDEVNDRNLKTAAITRANAKNMHYKEALLAIEKALHAYIDANLMHHERIIDASAEITATRTALVNTIRNFSNAVMNLMTQESIEIRDPNKAPSRDGEDLITLTIEVTGTTHKITDQTAYDVAANVKDNIEPALLSRLDAVLAAANVGKRKESIVAMG